MDYLLYYIEVGLIANAVAFGLEFFIALYLVFSLGLIEGQKFMVLASEHSDDNVIWGLIHYVIPFFSTYLLVVQLILINKYFDKTANSLDFIVKELDRYKIFKRFK